MDPSRPGPPPPFPQDMSPPSVRRNLSAESRPFAPATAAAAIIPTTRQQQQQPAAAIPSTPPAAAAPQPLRTPTCKVAPPVKSMQPYPEATPETVLPALVPRLTALLPLHELNIFLQASRRHLSAMEFLGSLKGVALRHPRDSGNSNNQQNHAKDTSQAPPPQALTSSAAAAAAPTATTPSPLKVLARFRRGLTILRLADRRVLPYLFLGVHQKLCSGIVTLVLRDLNMAEEDLLRLGVLLGKPHLLPALAHLHLSGRNRFTDNDLAAFAALGLNPSTPTPTPATTAGVAPQARTQPPAPGLQTLDLGGNGFTMSAQALEALAGAFEARSAVLLPPPLGAEDDDDDGHKIGEEEVKKASPGVGTDGGGRDKGTGVVGLRKLVLGQWCWGPRPSPSSLFPSSPTKHDEESKGSGSADAALLTHPLRRLLATPAVAATLEELDLLQARLLPGEVRALALALQDDSHHRLRILRLGLDPDAFATTTSVGRADDNEQGKTEEAVTPQKQQEETAVPAPNSSSLLPLFAALQAGCCPRLTTLDIDGRVDVPSLSSSPVIGPLGGEAVDALDAAVRGGKLRRLESLRLSRCALGANDLSQLLVALHAAAFPPSATTSSSSSSSSSNKQGGLRALSLEGNPALRDYGVQVLAMFIREGTLPQLHSLTIDSAGSGDKGLRDLTVAFESVALSQRGPLPLTALSLAGNDLTAEGVAWLGRALTAGALPKLESLSLANNPRIGADGGRYLAAFLLQMQQQQQQPATVCRIKALDLRWTELGVGGAEALALAVEKGACPALDRLHLAQGPNVPWSTETRTALHKLRDALLARSDPSPFSATEGAMQQQTRQQVVSTYVARRRAGAARRRAAAGGGPRVTCL